MDISYNYDYWVYIKMEPTESASDIPDLVIGGFNRIYNQALFS